MIGQMLKGAIAGAAATWVMELVTTGMAEGQSVGVTKREEAAQPNGKGTVPNLVDRVDAKLGLALDEDAKAMVGQVVHYGLGIAPGAIYAVLRRRLPLIGAANGLFFGAALWAANDEYLNSMLGLSGPFGAYPMETHLRGLVGHLALGTATDTVLDLLGG